MLANRALLLASMISLCAACQKHGDADEGQAESAVADGGAPEDGPSERAKDDRIPALSGAPVGVQAGWVEGAVVYASVRASAAQELFQSLPMGPREVRDLAEVGAMIGADPRVDDVLAHLGIAKDAQVSLSIRPVVTWAAELRQVIERDDPMLRELAAYAGRDERTKVEVIEAPPPDPSPDSGQDPSVAPPPVPLPVEPSAEAKALVRKAKSLGLHVRVHVPLSSPEKIDRLVAAVAENLRDERWLETCAAVGPARACGGENDGVVVLRDAPGALQIDLLLTFEPDYEQPDDEFRRAAIQQALAFPSASASVPAAGLRGDAVLYVDGPGVIAAMRAAALANTIDRLHDDIETERWRDERFAKQEEAIQSLHDTERMFEGVTVEDCRFQLTEMRLHKTPEELGAMRRAARAGALAIAEGIRSTRPGIGEWELDGVITFAQTQHGATGPAYDAIVGSGPNSLVLHYLASSRVLRAGEVVLVDFAPEYDHYVCDITRTWPTDGAWTPRMAELYDAVLAAQLAGIAVCKPGVTLREVDQECSRVLAERGFAKLMKHGACHFIGMEVHDPDSSLSGVELGPGACFTIEPGLYESETNIGIRIEDVVAITADGCEVLSRDVTKDRAELSALIAEEGILDRAAVQGGD